ncbi:MAG TPA: hypothetical protein VNM24_09280 [Burkholderiales bacterium]|jgi:hypothetical protein|nr:hypothetical protein [Burkholderiales bacterium]
MKTELFCLPLATLLTGLIWIPCIPVRGGGNRRYGRSPGAPQDPVRVGAAANLGFVSQAAIAWRLPVLNAAPACR